MLGELGTSIPVQATSAVASIASDWWGWILGGAVTRLAMDGQTRDLLLDRTRLPWRGKPYVWILALALQLGVAVVLTVLLCHPCNEQTAFLGGFSLGMALELLLRRIVPQ